MIAYLSNLLYGISMIDRDISKIILKDINYYSVLGIVGPRQSGKTTLAKALFPKMVYTNLEDLSQKDFAETDPKMFLAQGNNGMIIDEIQRVPSLLSYIQTIVDEKKSPGMYVITGSQNLLLMEQVSQTLAGRISLFTLLPLSLSELYKTSKKIPEINQILYRGLYPGIYDRSYEPNRYYRNYIQTYIERDVRQVKHITNLSMFQNFIKICAGRVGQIVNYSSIGDDLGVSHNTIKSWLSILETSFIIQPLRPYFKNFNKQIIKMPKLYFNDTGLLCSLLGISNPNEITYHYLKGGIFENLIVSEFTKYYMNSGRQPSLFFWRDKRGREVDLIIARSLDRIAIEIKSGSTISTDFFKNLSYYSTLDITCNASKSYIIYSGQENQSRTKGNVRCWQSLINIENEFSLMK